MSEEFWCAYFPLGLMGVGFLIAVLITNRQDKKLGHIHWRGRPIVSIYTSFNYRNVIYECTCGTRYMIKGVDATWLFHQGIVQCGGLPSSKDIESILRGEDTEMNRFIIKCCQRT